MDAANSLVRGSKDLTKSKIDPKQDGEQCEDQAEPDRPAAFSLEEGANTQHHGRDRKRDHEHDENTREIDHASESGAKCHRGYGAERQDQPHRPGRFP